MNASTPNPTLQLTDVLVPSENNILAYMLALGLLGLTTQKYVVFGNGEIRHR